MSLTEVQQIYTALPKAYAHENCFVVFCCGQGSNGFKTGIIFETKTEQNRNRVHILWYTLSTMIKALTTTCFTSKRN